MAVAGTQFTGANSQTVRSGAIPGIGFQAVVTVVHTVTYSTGGDTLDLSAIFPNEVIGGHPISDTQDDGGYKSTYVLGTAGAPASGILQMYYVDANNVADAAFNQVANAVALTAIDGQLWLFVGR
jgi:hypothetical protein